MNFQDSWIHATVSQKHIVFIIRTEVTLRSGLIYAGFDERKAEGGVNQSGARIEGEGSESIASLQTSSFFYLLFIWFSGYSINWAWLLVPARGSNPALQRARPNKTQTVAIYPGGPRQLGGGQLVRDPTAGAPSHDLHLLWIGPHLGQTPWNFFTFLLFSCFLHTIFLSAFCSFSFCSLFHPCFIFLYLFLPFPCSQSTFTILINLSKSFSASELNEVFSGDRPSFHRLVDCHQKSSGRLHATFGNV